MQPCIQEVIIQELKKDIKDLSNNRIKTDIIIEDILKRLDKLINILFKISYIAGAGVLTALGFLIKYWVKG